MPLLPELQHCHSDKGHDHINVPHFRIPHTAILCVTIVILSWVRVCDSDTMCYDRDLVLGESV